MDAEHPRPAPTPWTPADAAPTIEEPAPSPRRRGRRGRRVLATIGVLVLVALAGGGTAIGLQQRTVAAGWQQRAVILEQQRDDAIGRSEALSGQLNELGNLVQLSVEDLATLEERLAELAGEKARAEDRATLTAEELRTLAARVESSVRLLNACADDLLALQFDTIAAYNSLAGGVPVDVGPLNTRRIATSERCNEARQAGANAVALASRLR
jgi:hypothetical protein